MSDVPNVLSFRLPTYDVRPRSLGDPLVPLRRRVRRSGCRCPRTFSTVGGVWGLPRPVGRNLVQRGLYLSKYSVKSGVDGARSLPRCSYLCFHGHEDTSDLDPSSRICFIQFTFIYDTSFYFVSHSRSHSLFHVKLFLSPEYLFHCRLVSELPSSLPPPRPLKIPFTTSVSLVGPVSEAPSLSSSGHVDPMSFVRRLSSVYSSVSLLPPDPNPSPLNSWRVTGPNFVKCIY